MSWFYCDTIISNVAKFSFAYIYLNILSQFCSQNHWGVKRTSVNLYLNLKTKTVPIQTLFPNIEGKISTDYLTYEYLHVCSYSQSLNYCVIAYIKYISLRRAIYARFWFTFQIRFHLESSRVVYGSRFLEASEWEVRLWQKIRQISLMATPARISHSQIDPVNTKHIFCCFCFCFCCNVNKRSQFFIDVVLKLLISTWYTM